MHSHGHSSASFDPERVTLFAQTDARGSNIPFGIKAKDRTKHMYVIGKTGMGKSTLLENMAVQDIKNGEGMAFMDPHGATAEKLLEYIPEERIKDVLYFAPFDMQYPVSFNVMEDVGPDKRHLVVSGLMSTFKKIWVDAWSARMEYILSNTILALLEYPGSTLLGVNRMLSDKTYRDLVVANVKDPSVRSFWVDEFAKYNERYMQEAGDAIKNKIGQFTANPLIRNIVGQEKSSFDVRKMIEERKILIINLSKGLVGETNANLLGSMFITRIYLAAMSRADMPASELAKAPNFYLYVDEFQSFANETFANILSEARKYKLNLTIAHQYIEQMEEEVRNAVFGNVGTTISFRVGPFDAEVLETVFAPQFTAMDLVNLGFAQIYLTLMIDGIGSRPFSAITLPPIKTPDVLNVDRVIAASRKAYARPRAEVEVLIEAWHAPLPAPQKDRGDKDKGEKVVRKKLEEPRVVPRAETPQAPKSVEGAPAPMRQELLRKTEVAATVRPPRSAPPPIAPREKQASSGRSLEDLRAVLQRIAKVDTGSKEEVSQKAAPPAERASVPPPRPTASPERRPAPVPAPKPAQPARQAQSQVDVLKEALRAVVEAKPTPRAEGLSQNAQLKPKPEVPTPVAVPHAPTPAAPTASSRSEAQTLSSQKDENALTRERLEQMLAVSKKDRPPV